MALVFERIVTEGLGDLSYLIGDDESGLAAVIDPRADVAVYQELAQQHKVSISHILQTHIHEDFLSGAVALAHHFEGASLYMRHVDDASYGYEHEEISDGDRLELGSVILTARATPGHTPEHTSYLVCEKKRPSDPYAVFSGGSLLVNAVGRSDLLGSEVAQRLIAEQYRTLYTFYLGLPDGVILHPTHGHGSPCGADIGDRLSSTIGYERRYNPFLQHATADAFKQFAFSRLSAKPTYYGRLKEANTAGYDQPHLPSVPALTVGKFQAATMAENTIVIDVRNLHAFAGGHIPGALNVGGVPELSIWAGWMVDAQKKILLVMADDTDVQRIVSLFVRTGFTQFAGYLVGGMKAWADAGMPLSLITALPVHQLRQRSSVGCLIDVRSADEWEKGHIPGAIHIFLPELPAKMALLDKTMPVTTYCATGYRASIAASLLKAAGFDQVENVPGSWTAWCKAGFPVEK